FLSDKVSNIRAIRLTFDDTPTGKIYVTNFRGSAQGSSFVPFAERASESMGETTRAPRLIEQGNVIENVQFVPASNAGAAVPAAGASGTVRLNVRTQTPIPVGNELPTMFIGS